MIAMRLGSENLTGSVENLKSSLLRMGYFLAEIICFRPLARYKSYSGLKIFKIDDDRLIIHLKIIPEGSFDIENTFLSIMLIEVLLY